MRSRRPAVFAELYVVHSKAEALLQALWQRENWDICSLLSLLLTEAVQVVTILFKIVVNLLRKRPTLSHSFTYIKKDLG